MRSPPVRLLIVPGLHDSGPAHWQSWLQGLHRDALRVRQRDWTEPDLDRWAQRIASTVAHAGPGTWIVAAHSFGCLAVARWLTLQRDAPVHAALLVAPADPDKFGIAALLQGRSDDRLPVSSTLVGSETDPWMSAPRARQWAARWGSHWVDLGDAGHINAEAGFGPLPLAQRWVVGVQQRAQRRARPARASVLEWSFAV